ncbi:MAG: DNA polymerase III subunit delta, partial [Bacteroidetes bacterium]|nr:DNA polymerase III subunit delta [Bacteroidota bacterium]
ESHAKVLSRIKKDQIDAVYLFFGQEQFLAEQLIDEIILKTFNAPSDDFNLHVFYGRESSGESILNAAMSFPMLADRKVVVIKEADALNKASKDALAQYVKHPHDTTCLIAVSSKADFRQSFFKAFQECAVCVELPSPLETDIPEWIQHFVQAKGKKISSKAALLLGARIDLELMQLASQVDKLCSYIGQRESISEEDVEAVIGISRQYNIFQLCSAIFNKDLPRALHLFDQMMYYGASPVYMVVLIHRQLAVLWQICSMKEAGRSIGEIQGHLAQFKVWPDLFHNEYLPQASQFTAAEIQRAFEALLDADTQLKSSSVSDTIIMHKLLYTIVRGSSDG